MASPLATTPSQKANGTASIIQGDITKLRVDCIVNAANRSLMGGGGVDGAIHRAAGLGLKKECSTLNGCVTGDAKITSGYNLPCQFVIHTVGPVYFSEAHPEDLLRSCYRRSLELAVRNGLKSIGFSAISTGVYGYPSREAARAVVDEVRKFLDQPANDGKLERVVFCNFADKDMEAYRAALP